MSSNIEEIALLVAQSGPLNGQRWALTEPLLIGRDITCDIVVPDRQVSRHHARLTPTPQGVLLEDLDSKNGTHLNGKILDGAMILQDGDAIQIALSQKIVFLSSDATIPLDLDSLKLEQEYGSLERVTTRREEQMSDHPMMTRLHLDKRSHRVWIRIPERDKEPKASGQKQKLREIEIDPPLSASQFRMLEVLYDNQGQIVSRQEMISRVWGANEAIGVSEQALDALTRRLRDRLASIEPAHTYIVTVRGHGLRLDNPPIQE